MPCVSPVPLTATPPVPNSVEEPQAAAAAVAAAAAAAADSPAVPPPMMIEMDQPLAEAWVHCDSSSSAADTNIPLDLVPDSDPQPVLFTSVPPAVSPEDLHVLSGRGRTAPTADATGIAIAVSNPPLSPYAVRPSSVPRLVPLGSCVVDRDRNSVPDATVIPLPTPTPGSLLRLARTAQIYGAFLKPRASGPVGGTTSTHSVAATSSILDRNNAGSLHTTATHEVARSTSSPVASQLDAQLELVDVDSSEDVDF
jgi:hypothetical protein